MYPNAVFTGNLPSLYLSISLYCKSEIVLQKCSYKTVTKNNLLKICSKFTGEHPCKSVISIDLSQKF